MGKLAENVSNGSPIILHCSDGWDRTSQVAALSQILLDPFYRTLKGLCTLIDKDFCKFGHQFQLRQGHCNLMKYSPSHGSQNIAQEQSPILLQFLECVYQLVRVFPEEFEYDDAVLVSCHFNSTSCKFGTFLCNSDRERSQFQNSTFSFWEFIAQNHQKYKVNDITWNENFLEKVKCKHSESPWEFWAFWTHMYRQELIPGDKFDMKALEKSLKNVQPDFQVTETESGYMKIRRPNSISASSDKNSGKDPLGVL